MHSRNNLSLVKGRPRLLNLKQMIEYFVEHRKEVITRRTKFELKKAEDRAHILLGLKIALENIDRVVEIIKKSANVEEARNNLKDTFELSDKQAQAILDMKLQRLTSLETKKITDELEEVLVRIAYLKDLLANEHKIYALIKEETEKIKEKYGDERRTQIVSDEIGEFDIEDLIVKEDMVILISHNGLIKRVPLSTYKKQNRGGRGSSSVKLRDEDFIEQIFIASTHDYLMFITSAGKAYCAKVHEIPLGSKTARGQSVKSLLAISTDEEVATVISFKEFSEDIYILMATSRGVVKKVATSKFSNARKKGIISIKLDSMDKVVTAKLTDGNDELIFVTKIGYALRFNEKAIRPMGRATRGVTGIKLSKEDELAGVLKISEGEKMLLVSEYGYGKRIECSNFTPHHRATRGQICYKTSDKTGELVGVISAAKQDDFVCITSQGIMIKIELNDISVQGKAAMGVKVVNINKPDIVVGIARVIKEDEVQD